MGSSSKLESKKKKYNNTKNNIGISVIVPQSISNLYTFNHQNW